MNKATVRQRLSVGQVTLAAENHKKQNSLSNIVGVFLQKAKVGSNFSHTHESQWYLPYLPGHKPW